ncbi:hypothetical protein EDM68_01870 [Candidatus Uhrbacteria bacterium]|nr:MAG: hypothetical protein EDM68_01870 [Candidatus Uhrbacteria bacterium]
MVSLLARLLRRMNFSGATLPTQHALDTPYRDSKDARIRALEEEVRRLHARLREAEDKTHARSRVEITQWPWAKAVAAAGCVVAANWIVLGSVCFIPSHATEAGWRHRVEPPPTMAPVPVRTSGGEIPVAIPRSYVIVLFSATDRGRCYDGVLTLEPTYAIVQTDRFEWVQIVWVRLVSAYDVPRPHLQL